MKINRHKILMKEYQKIFILEDSRKYIRHLTFKKSILPSFSNAIHIDELAIDSQCMGKGIETELIKKVIEETKNLILIRYFLKLG